ncbi:nuclear transport factor 2 family protein [Nocardia paucivorans]|uniref:nuclear transport factor 2 family protein n=1 Tax=Nocardia paucivorans TaxID=114259 RepID=UPI0002D6B017|nr:nuclear transport factor 2 family protein [Nocardia paucivorans]
MSEADTRTVVTEFLRRVTTGDPDAIADLFTETVDWRVNWPEGEHPSTPWIRPRSTRAEVADHFRALAESHVPAAPPTDAPAPTILVDGADAVVLTEIRQTAALTGRSYTAGCALHFTVQDGVITRYHIYEDSLAVARAFA